MYCVCALNGLRLAKSGNAGSWSSDAVRRIGDVPDPTGAVPRATMGLRAAAAGRESAAREGEAAGGRAAGRGPIGDAGRAAEHTPTVKSIRPAATRAIGLMTTSASLVRSPPRST